MVDEACTGPPVCMALVLSPGELISPHGLECLLSARMSQLVWVGVIVLHVSYSLKWLVIVGHYMEKSATTPAVKYGSWL